MSYSDPYDEPRRPSRRAVREPAGPAKVQGSTAAAILVFVAIVGFGIGALIGNSGGDDPATTTGADLTGAATGSPDTDLSATPGDTAGEEPTESSTDDADDGEVVGGEGITLTSLQDGGEVTADESGTIDVQAALDSAAEGVPLRVQRSLDRGETWEDFCGECTGETSGSGTFSTNFWSGRSGENLFRIVGPDGLTSNPISVNVVDGDGDGDGDGEDSD